MSAELSNGYKDDEKLSPLVRELNWTNNCKVVAYNGEN